MTIRPFAYQSSVGAYSLDLYTTKRPRKGIKYSGVELRPMIFEEPKPKKSKYLKQLMKIFS